MDNEELSIVDAVESDTMLVSWDLGRRCNYDCTYCPAHRHDNFSEHASLEELQRSAQFVFDYLGVMMPKKYRKRVSISFTGGEPTANPNFIAFGKWLRSHYEANYQESYHLNLSLTTNGAMSRKMCDSLIQNYNFSTISYHCEAKDKVKQNVISNIMYLHEKKFPIKINVMFHAREDYFEECKQLCLKLQEAGVDFVPRMIGEYEDNNRYHHKYSPEQIQWMKDFWDDHKRKQNGEPPKPKAAAIEQGDQGQDVPKEKQSARSLGRPCCGKRVMNVCSSDKKTWTKTSFLSFAKFEGWYCSVNWFFLHIEQQTGEIYHHQTCQAKFGGKRGSIGNLADTEAILAPLRENIANNTMPVIVCPNKICGCGLCTPKAKSLDDFKKILPPHVSPTIFRFEEPA